MYRAGAAFLISALLTTTLYSSTSSVNQRDASGGTCGAAGVQHDGRCKESEAPDVNGSDDAFFDKFLPPEKRRRWKADGPWASCMDDDEKCGFWADEGECASNPDYMLKRCRKSCLACVDSEFFGIKQVVEGDEEQETLEVLLQTQGYIRNVVWAKPEYRSVRSICLNRHKQCAFWAATGECEKNPSYMALQCAPSCQTCHKIDIKKRCPLDPDTKNALGPGDLNKIFERIVTDEEYAKYAPTVHSRPSRPPEGGDNLESDAGYQLGPWVVMLNNFLSSVECQILIDLGLRAGYEPSMDIGEAQFDGTYADKLELEKRTSQNAWCVQADCYEEPVVQRVMDRIVNLTGIPETNSEYMQLLKYDLGQFDGLRHDYLQHQAERQPGVRVVTLFLFLNDVDLGGGNNFPLLNNLTIVPKMGSALLWPSVLDEDPNSKDDRTDHQELPVEQGVKYAANVWLHQRDFKGPNMVNCH